MPNRRDTVSVYYPVFITWFHSLTPGSYPWPSMGYTLLIVIGFLKRQVVPRNYKQVFINTSISKR
jgi:hypothetical protein